MKSPPSGVRTEKSLSVQRSNRSPRGKSDRGYRSSSPDRQPTSPVGTGVKYLDHRTRTAASRPYQRGGGRNDRRPNLGSPDRNFGGSDFSRPIYQQRAPRYSSPPRDPIWDDRNRPRGDSRNRGVDIDNGYDDRRAESRKRSRGGRSLSPLGLKGASREARRDDEYLQSSTLSQRSRSPDRGRSRRSDRRSRSASVSPARREPSPVPEKSKKKSKKMNSNRKEAPLEERPLKSREKFVDSDKETETKLDSKGKRKGKKKTKDSNDMEDSLESSFERSKKYLGSHPDEFDIPEPEKTEVLSPPPAKKKSKSKRAMETSDSETDSPRKVKKSKESDRNEPMEPVAKKSKKSKKDMSGVDQQLLSPEKSSSVSPRKSKSKKTSRKSYSRSPGGMDRSRSSEASLGRHHDMAQFESEPESGEITDSEEEGRQGVKSLVNVSIKCKTKP